MYIYIYIGKYERSTLEFDRQLSLAKEIKDTPEMAEANLGLGSSYILRFDFLGAVRYLYLRIIHNLCPYLQHVLIY
jgi:hypothetical protein